MVEVAYDADLTNLACYIHTLQLIVTEGLKTQKVANDTVATARAIVGYFRHSV